MKPHISHYTAGIPLSEEEILYRLDPKKRFEDKDVIIDDQWSVIKINSTYMDLVGPGFNVRGGMTCASGIGLLIMAFGGLSLCIVCMINFIEDIRLGNFDDLFVGLVALLVVLAVFAFFGRIYFAGFAAEAFGYTHYPIRFNRKTHMVHFFEGDGTVTSVPWDDMYFCMSPKKMGSLAVTWGIRGYLLDKHNRITKGMPFGFVTSMVESMPEEIGHKKLYGHWELVRRYMEEGPETMRYKIKRFIPVDRAKESFAMSRRIMSHSTEDGPAVIHFLSAPFNYIESVGRWLANKTSKIPVWPPEAKAEIEPGDPYEGDYRHNPYDMRD